MTVVEADDGTNIGTGPNLSDLGGLNQWNPANGVPPVGSWVVLESLNSNNTNHFQVLIHITSTTNIAFYLIPFQDFVTGGGTTAPPLPTLPTTTVGRDGTATNGVNMTVSNGVARYSCVATEGNFIFLHHSSDDMNIYYCGEVDDPSTDLTIADDRAYVHYRETTRVYVEGSAFQEPWIRMSPVDGTTRIGYLNDSSKWAVLKAQSDKRVTYPPDSERATIDGDDPHFVVGVYFRDAGHDHIMGYLRNMYNSYGSIGRAKLTDSLGILHVCNDQSKTGIAIKWDGATGYG